MICHDLLKFPFARNFPNKIIVVFSLIVLGTLKYDCDIKREEILSALPLKNNSVTIVLNFLSHFVSAIISSKTINTLLFFVGL